MSNPRSFDVIVIGAGICGLAAAALLARSGRAVVVVDGGAPSPPPGVHTLHALDPALLKALRLAKRGLRFVVRDMNLVGLRADGRHLVLTRDAQATALALACHSRADAEAWPRTQGEFYALARAMRPHWWNVQSGEALARVHDKLEPFRRMGAAAWLDSRFESEALKATLAFDAVSGGLSPFEPGSALTLLWRVAQEMCGLQGAVAMVAGGPRALVELFAAAARDFGADLRTASPVARILVDGGKAMGVRLATGEVIAAPVVLSSLSRRLTLCSLLSDSEAGLGESVRLEREVPRVGAARVTLTLGVAPQFKGASVPMTARFVSAEKLESYAAAHAAACAGRLADEIPMELTVPTAADSALVPAGRHLVSALLRPVPLLPQQGWAALKSELTQKVLRGLRPYVPDLAHHVVDTEVTTPDDILVRNGLVDGAAGVAHMLADWPTRVGTPLEGLMLCGAAAEPMPAISGRAARIVAEKIVKDAKR